MRLARLRFVVCVLVAAAAHAARAPELIEAVAIGPALFSATGLGWARRLHRDPLGRELAAVWISIAVLVPLTLAARAFDLGPWAILGGSAVIGAAGLVGDTPRAPWERGRVARAVALAVTVYAAWTWRDAIARPLEGYWYDAAVDAGWDPPRVVPHTGGGWRSIHPLPGGAWGFVPESDHPYLLGPFDGTALVVLQAPVGARAVVGRDALEVRADPVEDRNEGPVPRYLDRGVTSRLVTGAQVTGERIEVTLSDPVHSVLLVVPDVGAVWELHAAGLLRHTHYYQLLNMVEQLRWVHELGGTRWITDVQPPLWTWVLAGPLTVTGGALVTANVTFAWLLVALTLAGLAALRAWAPEVPGPAWLLPGFAAAVHAKLLYEPGSADLPDTLYTFAAVSAFAALGPQGGGPAGRSSVFPTFGLVAQLVRYPGTLLTGLLAIFAGEPRQLARLGVVVVIAMVTFGLVGLASGQLTGWVETAWFETFEEHWHGNADPGALLARIPGFYTTWLTYAGGAPLLAALAWPRGTRTALGAAFAYSLLLCSVDHLPSHYFLPLLHLSVLALGATSARLSRPWKRWLLAGVGCVGLFITWTVVPVT